MTQYDYDMITIGGGSGGVRAARLYRKESHADDVIITCATECVTKSDIEAYAAGLWEALK